MNRKEFLKKTSLATAIIASYSITGVFADSILNSSAANNTDSGDLNGISDQLKDDFLKLIKWLKENKWTDLIKYKLSLDLDSTDLNKLISVLTKPIKSNDLTEKTDLKNKIKGLDDFAGNQLITPGAPALSLLYHLLASPRVKPESLKEENYPSIKELDTLENFIYALKRWQDIKKDHDITTDKDLVLAVFAYEYRTAFKTPHHSHADLVFSRTGIARIGETAINYNAINRSYTNKPRLDDDPSGKKIAVTPARYGLFLAKVVKKDNISIISSKHFKGDYDNGKSSGYKDDLDDRLDDQRDFLLPIRKVFKNDLLLGNAGLIFHEYHINEKLSILPLSTQVSPKLSVDLVETDIDLTNNGSSFLVISKCGELIKQNSNLSFRVDTNSVNRYFSTYLQGIESGNIYIDVYQGSYRQTNKYKSGRNRPMYVHIAHELNNNNTVVQIPKKDDNSFEIKINNGGYNTPIYEDKICDGVVTVEILNLKNDEIKAILNKGIIPAFSVITAPDFFPYVTLYDILKFDVPPGESSDSNFYEGGVSSLATARIRPNPKLLNPINSSAAFPSSSNEDKLYNTFTAVVSSKEPSVILPKVDPSVNYDFNSFLPDVCSSVFAPGWDVTYGGNIDNTLEKPFLSTKGLGSPFVEDMKLCAAMNGMWAVASPDTARVFQGTVTADKKTWWANPTAIPLMDDELGFHANSPANNIAKRESKLGWDGEQGPFLEYFNSKWTVNFIDLGRADYVANIMDHNIGFDMSKLRELRSDELISRMGALKTCIRHIYENYKTNSNSVALTNLWLVSAEKYNNGFEGNGIPINLKGNNKSWATTKMLTLKEYNKYFLFVFAKVGKDKKWNNKQWAETGNNVKRRRLTCEDLYVCHVSELAIKACQIIKSTRLVDEINWI